MKDEKDFIRSVLNISKANAEEINNRCVRALRINTMHATKLAPQGEEYAMHNHLDNAMKAWLLYHMTQKDFTPREAIECVMEFITSCVLPSLIKMPEIRKEVIADMKDSRDEPEADILRQINDMLQEAGFEPIVAAGTLPEIIEQLQGLHDSESETIQ